MSVAVASALSSQATQFRKADGQKRRVLYAEDQASARIVTTALLERMGFDVEAVEDGELAFEKAMHTAYDIILLDIEMPVMDGVTAARNIRATAELCRETPILALSAFLADSTEHSVWRDAFDSALPKPANSNELQKALSRVLRSRESLVVAPHANWQMLAGSLPAGVLANLRAAALKEMNHLILAHAACVVAGDADTAGHCCKVLKRVALSFEVRDLIALLDKHETAQTQPSDKDLIGVVNRWATH
jgi:CheY-like chemotaxis protein